MGNLTLGRTATGWLGSWIEGRSFRGAAIWWPCLRVWLAELGSWPHRLLGKAVWSTALPGPCGKGRVKWGALIIKREKGWENHRYPLLNCTRNNRIKKMQVGLEFIYSTQQVKGLGNQGPERLNNVSMANSGPKSRQVSPTLRAWLLPPRTLQWTKEENTAQLSLWDLLITPGDLLKYSRCISVCLFLEYR